MWTLLACATDPYLATDASSGSADALVLLARISPAAVTVEGVLDGPARQTVDLDAPADDRYGFRYRVLDADGDALYERSTLGPVLVESFLEYWSVEAGVDILASLPSLGAFALQVPRLEGADSVAFEVRGDDGEYALRGRWDYADADALRVAPEAGLVRGVEVLHGDGDPEDQVDFAIVADGYREEELALFAEHADVVAEAVLATEPFASFADRVGIARIDVASAQSGASYDCPTCSVVDNAFGSIFAIELVNRVAGTRYDSRAIFQADQWRVAHALADVPWDAVLVLVNSPQFGGMAVHHATATTGPAGYAETSVHELGHAFGMLGDEYVYDACIRSGALGLPENVTDDGEHPPWDAWIAPDMPLPSPDRRDGVGAFEGAWNCPDLYRPEKTCLMNETGPFCAVCSELLVRRILRHVDPAASVHLAHGALRVTGAMDGAVVVVRADGEVVGEGTVEDPPQVPRRAGALEVEVRAGSAFVREDPYADLAERWTFEQR